VAIRGGYRIKIDRKTPKYFPNAHGMELEESGRRNALMVVLEELARDATVSTESMVVRIVNLPKSMFEEP